MRLININTLEFEEFYENDIPSYAILSHRWSDYEITYNDYAKGRRQDSQGYRKVLDLCATTRRYNGWLQDLECTGCSSGTTGPASNGASWNTCASPPGGENANKQLQYVWVDTCCIDKRSSAELSEAINVMFHWYARASICFVYLSDVHVQSGQTPINLWRSQWWSRGWTLQEMLAPSNVLFCDQDWTFMAHKCPSQGGCCLLLPPTTHSNADIAQATGVAKIYVDDPSLIQAAPAAQVFSWAAWRKTSRVEDMSYCLLGLLSVNMPLLYGEGSKAFRRLQEVVLRDRGDHSVLIHGHIPDQVICDQNVLSNNVRSFLSCQQVGPPRTRIGEPLTFTSGTLRLSGPSIRVSDESTLDFLLSIRTLSRPPPDTIQDWEHWLVEPQCTVEGRLCVLWLSRKILHVPGTHYQRNAVIPLQLRGLSSFNASMKDDESDYGTGVCLDGGSTWLELPSDPWESSSFLVS